MENGRVRLAGTGAQVLGHPEIGALYLGGGARTADAAQSDAAQSDAAQSDAAGA
jgi:hypothetical protein